MSREEEEEVEVERTVWNGRQINVSNHKNAKHKQSHVGCCCWIVEGFVFFFSSLFLSPLLGLTSPPPRHSTPKRIFIYLFLRLLLLLFPIIRSLHPFHLPLLCRRSQSSIRGESKEKAEKGETTLSCAGEEMEACKELK